MELHAEHAFHEERTNVDASAAGWRRDDEVVRLRLWGSEHAIPLPAGGAVIGASESCSIPVVDRSGWTSRRHARLERGDAGWFVRDLESKNGTWVDGVRCDDRRLDPGAELGIGGVTFVAESRRCIDLRGFVSRLLGWSADRLIAVDFALRAIRLAAARRLPLVLCGPGDLIAIAHALHRRALGVGVFAGSDRDPAKTFVVCDPRRRDGEESVRSAGNLETGMEALARARGGSLCMWSRRLPRDFTAVRAALRDPVAHVQLIVCAESRQQAKPYQVEPIVVPPLSSRAGEIRRVIDEYAHEAATFMRSALQLSAADLEWILRNSASSIPEIEKGAHRPLAIRKRGNTAAAARELGMAPISLARWMNGREPIDRNLSAAAGLRALVRRACSLPGAPGQAGTP